MALPVFGSVQVWDQGSGAVVYAPPSGLATDDVELLVIATINVASSLSTANGFVQIYESPGQTGGANGIRIAVYARQWDGIQGDPTHASVSGGNGGVRARWTGCRTDVTPWSVLNSNEQTTQTTVGSCSGGTPGFDDALLIAISGSDEPASGTDVELSGWTNTIIGSFAERFDDRRSAGPNGLGFGFADGGLVTDQASGAVTFTSVTTAVKENVIIALEPPPSAAAEFAVEVSGTAAVVAALTSAITMAAEFLGSATVAAALTTSITMATEVQGAATVDAALSVGAVEFAVEVTGSATVDAALQTAIEMAVEVSGTATVDADLKSGADEFAVEVVGSATVDADLAAPDTFAVEVLGSATVDAALAVPAVFAVELLGSAIIDAALTAISAVISTHSGPITQTGPSSSAIAQTGPHSSVIIQS